MQHRIDTSETGGHSERSEESLLSLQRAVLSTGTPRIPRFARN